jgi:hypothetical protein
MPNPCMSNRKLVYFINRGKANPSSSSSNRALRKSHQINEMPVVIFVTSVDVSNNTYRISSLTLTYPVLSVNDELRANNEKLKIHLGHYYSI